MKNAFLMFVAIVALSGVALVAAPGQSVASVGSEGKAVLRGFDLNAGSCTPDEGRAELTALRDRIARAPDLDASRVLALDQTNLARKALSRAKWVIPFNGALGDASRKLDAYEVRVKEAGSPEEVAAAFGDLVRLASADDLTIVDAEVKADCHYTTGEIVIIVIGFLLAIIPGFIFMAILC
ncbi:MAG: hypothetical protein ACE5FC_00185 [Myxococcota bacterium]